MTLFPGLPMMTSSNGTIFRVTGPLCGEFTGPLNSPHKGQWRGALVFSLICVWINGWVNNREAGDLRRHRGHYDVSVMLQLVTKFLLLSQGKVPTSWHRDAVHITGHNWIPLTKSQQCGALMFSLLLISIALEQVAELPLVWDAITLMWRHTNKVIKLHWQWPLQ